MLLLDDDDELSAIPSEQEQVLASELGDAGLKKLDEAILEHSSERWLKVARIIGKAIETGRFEHSFAAVELHNRRVIELVKNGSLDSQGNLNRPRFSEVRLVRG